MNTHPTAPPHRRHDLDAIRVGAFSLLILYHIGMFYVPWDWHVNSARPQEWLEPVMRFTSPWRLTLLFLVSGAAAHLLLKAYQRQGPGASERLAGSRMLRLFLPLLFGMFVIVPPQTYFEVVQHVRDNGLAPDIYHNALTADFWVRYATSQGKWCDADGCIITPTWNHLWFVAYAMVYGLLAALIAGWLGSRLTRVSAVFDRLFRGPWVLILPIAWLALIRMWLSPLFPITHDLFSDLYNHALSLSAFGFGFLLVDAPRVTETLKRYRHLSLLLALTAYGVWISYMILFRDSPVPPLLRQGMRAVYAIDQWAFIAAILGYAAQHVRGTNPLMQWLGGGVFCFYIVHQTITVVAAALIEQLQLPLYAEMLLLVAITVTGCLLSYVIARRLGVFGILLGVTPRRRGPAGPKASGLIP